MSNEISAAYNLPEGWEKEKAISFSQLTEMVVLVHTSSQTAAVKAVNSFATVRNYVIGFYIVEYEQKGNDRAKYGEKL